METVTEKVAKLRIEKRSPTREEYRSLTNQSDGYTVENQFTKTAFGKEVFRVVVLDGPNLIGMGRVIGDGAIYFCIQDITVHPNYSNKSVSRLIMDQIEAYFETVASRHFYVGVIAGKGTKELYKTYGFIERKTKSSEMFKIAIRGNG